MKKLLIFVIIFIFTNLQVFAQTTIELSTSSTGITLEDEFELQVKIISDKDFEGGELKISGLDSFYNTYNQSISQYSSVNGETKQIQTFKLGFFPNETGNFIIGPAIISDLNNEYGNDIQSNAININVKNTENKQEVISENNNENSIEGLKNIQKYNFDFGDFNYLFLLLFIIIILYYLYNKYFRKKIIKNSLLNNQTSLDYNKLIIKRLKKLKKDGENLKKNIFYEKLNFIFKDYFQYIGINDSHTKTYEELYKDIENKILVDLFKESYFFEFNNKKDDFNSRIVLIDNFIKEINK